MKLVFCPECQDVFKLKRCLCWCFCGKSSGHYIDDVKAEIRGKAIPLGFDNTSFLKALKARPKTGKGKGFRAFVIPRECETVEEKT